MKEDEKVQETKKAEAAISGPETPAATSGPTTTTAAAAATAANNVSTTESQSGTIQPQDTTGESLEEHWHIFNGVLHE